MSTAPIIYEVNFDGLVGPTHTFGGLSTDNVASGRYKHTASNPKAAALEGLKKMKLLADLGIKQAILLPHQRPYLPLLHQLGFRGTTEQMLTSAYKHYPQAFAACFSSSSMWAANAAFVTSSVDSCDHKLHITPANLQQHLHRMLETPFTARLLQCIFHDQTYFVHHDPLPNTDCLSDEGAANYIRLSETAQSPGLHFFVHGRNQNEQKTGSASYQGRQTLLSQQALARLHQLDARQVIYAQQNPKAIEAGVFHNDVIALGHRQVFLCHELAFAHQQALLTQLEQLFPGDLYCLSVSTQQLSLIDAVSSYLFNSQLVSLPVGPMAMIAPKECQMIPSAKEVLLWLQAGHNPIADIYFADCTQSMHNGGGPACLRLCVPLTAQELNHIHQGVLFSDELYQSLVTWVNTHYRDNLTLEDCLDPKLIDESYRALDELTSLFSLGSMYDFQISSG